MAEKVACFCGTKTGEHALACPAHPNTRVGDCTCFTTSRKHAPDCPCHFYEVPEAVDHPAHYNVGKIEVIDAIEDWQLGFHEGNVVKYVARAKHKGKELEDLKKAAWYLNRRIAELEEAVRQDPPPKGQRGYNKG